MRKHSKRISELRKKLVTCLGPGVSEHSVLAGKIRTHYLSAGDSTAHPVVLVHGHSVTGSISWGPVITLLSSKFHVIAPDVVGYGESEKPAVASYDRHYFSRWLRYFYEAIGLQNASLIGISQGGAISIQYTLDQPDMVDKLVLINSAGLGKWIPPLGFAMSMAFRQVFPSYLASRWNSSYMVQNPENIDKNLVKYGIKLSRRIESGFSLLRGRGKSATPFRFDQLNKIMQPTLFLCGEKDKIMPHHLSEHAKRIIPNAQITVIPDAGHSLFFDRPDLVQDVLVNFLNG